jgi:hypothetical protein
MAYFPLSSLFLFGHINYNGVVLLLVMFRSSSTPDTKTKNEVIPAYRQEATYNKSYNKELKDFSVSPRPIRLCPPK